MRRDRENASGAAYRSRRAGALCGIVRRRPWRRRGGSALHAVAAKKPRPPGRGRLKNFVFFREASARRKKCSARAGKRQHAGNTEENICHRGRARGPSCRQGMFPAGRFPNAERRRRGKPRGKPGQPGTWIFHDDITGSLRAFFPGVAGKSAGGAFLRRITPRAGQRRKNFFIPIKLIRWGVFLLYFYVFINILLS